MKLSNKSFFWAALVAFVWTVCAIASIALREHGGTVLLIWFPSAIATSALFIARKNHWLAVLVGLALANVVVNLWFGLGLGNMAGYVAANLVEPILIVLIADKVIGNRGFDGLRLRQMVALFAAALAGSLLSALISLPFRPSAEWAQIAWWVLATLLGTSVGAPMLLSLYYWLRKAKTRQSGFVESIPLGFLASILAIFVVSTIVLNITLLPTVSAVMMMMVFVVVRYGQVGASLGILAFGLAGTVHSFGGNNPAAYLVGWDRVEAGITLQIFMLMMMATSLPLAALLMQHDRLALRLKARNARMRDNLLMLRMAEEVARIGRWRYDPRTGIQDWSRQMYLINGLDPNLGRDPGNLKSMLPDGGLELFGQLSHHAADRGRYSFEYHVIPPHSEIRTLKMYATNEFNEKGELAGMFGVVMDVSEHHQRQEALDRERTRAMRLAAEAQYLAHTDPLTGLANRRRTITQLEKCIRRCEQDDRLLALISFDIDHFKRVNDTRGHQTGDDVLMRIADIARAQSRASDLIGRMGGEEFIWMLPDAGPDEARAAAERLRDAIEHESATGGLPQVTASVGYALWRKGDDGNALLARVDTALYEAKDAGRNLVCKAA